MSLSYVSLSYSVCVCPIRIHPACMYMWCVYVMMRWCDDVMMWWCDDVMMWHICRSWRRSLRSSRTRTSSSMTWFFFLSLFIISFVFLSFVFLRSSRTRPSSSITFFWFFSYYFYFADLERKDVIAGCDDVMIWWCDDVTMWWCDDVMMQVRRLRRTLDDSGIQSPFDKWVCRMCSL